MWRFFCNPCDKKSIELLQTKFKNKIPISYLILLGECLNGQNNELQGFLGLFGSFRFYHYSSSLHLCTLNQVIQLNKHSNI